MTAFVEVLKAGAVVKPDKRRNFKTLCKRATLTQHSKFETISAKYKFCDKSLAENKFATMLHSEDRMIECQDATMDRKTTAKQVMRLGGECSALITTSIGKTHLFELVSDFIDHGLLGLLFSTKHFQLYCHLKAKKEAPNYVGLLEALSVDIALASEFQQKALTHFNGLNIDACVFTTDLELSNHLKEKLDQVFELDAVKWPGIDNPLEIQNAWKYRRACKGIRL